jgi:hypothetical protein
VIDQTAKPIAQPPALKVGEFVQFTAADGRIHVAMVVMTHAAFDGKVNLVVFGKQAGDEACSMEPQPVRWHPDPQFFNTWRKLPA